MVAVLLWLLTGLLTIFGAVGTIGNFVGIALAVFRGRSYSLAPFIGGGFLAIAFWICPVVELNRYAWIPLLVDPGCALMIVLGRVSILTSYFKRNAPEK